ncbi:MAG: class I SAM-dependent methyltransferase [Rhodomicrobium sp.]
MLAAKLLSAFLTDASLLLIDHKGAEYHCGPKTVKPSIAVRLRNPADRWRFLLAPRVTFGEGYTAGEIVIEKGSLRDLVALISKAHRTWRQTTPRPLQNLLRSWSAATNFIHQVNTKARSRRNAQHHYDIKSRVFELFLDPAMQYTCAYFTEDVLPAAAGPALQRYFEHRTEDLDAAQRRRMAHMIAKLRLAPGMRVLDIGCGWGGLAIEMARQCQVEVLGITLSSEQLAYAEDKARKAGLTSQVRFLLADYRDAGGTFDRIVAAGVLEHIGTVYYKTFLLRLKALLAPEGIVLIDAAGRVDGPGGTDSWLRKHIYPGGYIPALSEVQRAVEASGLETLDVEIMRMHYAFTVREWERRFMCARNEISGLMGEEFVRMFQLYLLASEMSFVYGQFVNFQLQLSNSRFAAPVTRDYLSKHEFAGCPT